jgi:hypothetical protein
MTYFTLRNNEYGVWVTSVMNNEYESTDTNLGMGGDRLRFPTLFFL